MGVSAPVILALEEDVHMDDEKWDTRDLPAMAKVPHMRPRTACSLWLSQIAWRLAAVSAAKPDWKAAMPTPAANEAEEAWALLILSQVKLMYVSN